MKRTALNRRDFLRASAATGAGLALLGSMETLAAAQGTPTGSSAAGGALSDLPHAPGADQPGADPNATLTINLGNEITTGDPQVINALNEIAICSKAYAPLLTLDQENNIAAAGAVSMTTSEDGKTYTFKIRPGLTYSDGKPCTANDYAYAIQRALSPVVAGNYSNILFAVTGGEAWRTADPDKDKAKLPELQKVVENAIRAVDEETLQIQLDHAAGYFPYVLTTWVTYPVRKDLVEGKGPDWWKEPKNFVGNGPFKLVKWTPKQEWVYERNDSYFGGKPGIAKWTFKEITSTQTEFLAYQKGELDTAGPDANMVPQIEADPKLKSQFHRKVGANTWWLSFNNSKAPFDNVKVRQAIAAALNREQYIKQINHGVGTPADQLLYSGIAGYTTSAKQSYDPAKAKQLLSDAGFPDGKGFPRQQLRYNNNDTTSQQIATFWSQNLKDALNIEVTPTPTDPAQLQAMVNNRDPSLNFFSGDWYEDYPHPQNWLSLVYGPHSNRAPLGWDDPHFNELVTKADALPLDQAKPLYEQAEAYLTTQAPVAFTYHQETLALIKPNLKGGVEYPTDPFDMRYQPEKIYKTK